tara:strand:+ start:614 stop:1099 length:486 start_codon:yes stop_codon:yes gene_type:complete
MGGGGHTTTHHETKTPNDYNDAWIRSKFDTIDQRYTDFSNWRSGREAQLGYESRQRDANAAALAQLQGDYRGVRSDLEGLGSRHDELRGDFRGLGETTTSRFADLTDAQRQQFKDIYDLNQKGTGTGGVKTTRGLTAAERRGGGSYGGFNRGGMRISSLNV